MAGEAAIATASAPKVEFKPIEVLSAHGKAKEQEGRVGEAQRKIVHISELRAQRRSREIFEEGERRFKEARFSSQNTEGLKFQFGAGETKRGPDGKILPPESEEAKGSYEAATEALDQISMLQKYAEIKAEAERTGKGPGEILAKRDRLQQWNGAARWELLRNDALDILLKQDIMQQFSELNDIVDPQARRDFIEETLASDPKLLSKIAERMTQIEQRVKALPGTKPEKQKTLEQQALMQSRIITEQVSLICTKLNVQLDDNELKFILATSDNTETAQHQLLMTAAKKTGISNPQSMEKYCSLETRAAQIRTRIDAIKGKRLSLHEEEEQIKPFKKQLLPIEADINAYKTLFEETGIDDQQLKSQQIQFNQIQEKIYGSINGRGEAIGGIRSQVEKIIMAKDQLSKTGIELTGEEFQQETSQSRSERLRQESELIDELQEVLPGTIAETLRERQDEMNRFETLKINQEAEVSRQKGEEEFAKGQELLGQVKNERWIIYDEDTRNKEVDREKIRDDIRLLAYQGKEGAKVLLLEELIDEAESAGAATAKGRLFSKINRTDLETIGLSTLNEEQRKVLDQLYDSTAGKAYIKKLFTDFSQAQGVRHEIPILRGRFGTDLHLKNHEWAMLEENFGEFLEGTIKESGSKEAQKLLEQAERKKGKKGSKLKLLLAILAGMGIMGYTGVRQATA